MNSSRYSWFAVIAAILWLFVVVFNYYIVHKPFGVENALALLNALGDVLVAAVLLTLATAVGRRLTRALTFAMPLEALAFHAGLGLGVLSLTTLALGLAGLLNRVLFWLLLLLAAFFLRRDLALAWRDLRAIQLPSDSRFERALAFFVAASLAMAFLFALTPPVAWDAQTYHLVEAKVALERGRIAAPPDIVYLSFPSLVEMLFLAAMLLKDDIAAQLIHFEFFLLALGAVFAFARRYFNARIAWLACAILVAVPSLLTVSTWAYVDLALVFYAFTAFYALMLAREMEDWRWFALAGAFAGLAMGVKYTGAIVPLALILLLSLAQRSRHATRNTQPCPERSRRDVPRITHHVSFISFVALLAVPWYLRNLAFTGNPVYPFFFDGTYWDAFRANWFGRFGTGLLNTPLQLLTAPWDATIYGREGALGYEATIGPLLLMLLPLLIVQIRDSNYQSRFSFYVLGNLLIFSLVLYLFWLTGIAGSKLLLQTRLLFPAFPTLALAAAVALDRLNALDLPQFSAQRFARLVILLILGLTVLSYVLDLLSSDALAYLGGFESRAAYLSRRLGGYYAMVEFVNTRLPRDANVLFLWEPRSYYARRMVQPDVLLDKFGHLRNLYRDADGIARALRDQGYTHLVLHRAGLNYFLTSGYDPIFTEDVRVLQEILTRQARQIYGESALDVQDGAIVRANEEPYAAYEIVR